MRKRKSRLGIAATLAFAALLALGGSSRNAQLRAEALQSADSTGHGPVPFRSFTILQPNAMSAADAELVHAKQREIAGEAAFWGYHLNAASWDYDQVECPDMPDRVMLHYRSRSQAGAEWLFTALVPRGKGRVLIVPVLYGNATPVRPAPEAERTISVFNQAVPAEIAAQAGQPDGPWLNLAMCYAALAGAEPHVPERTDEDPGLMRAPVPTFRMSEGTVAQTIQFTDRNTPQTYRVWTLGISQKGRITAAAVKSYTNFVPQKNNPASPKEQVMPAGAEPQPQAGGR